jgi:diguanylate cyclase (GGDEF)-like protein
MQYLQLFVYTFLIAVLANYLRFRGSNWFNKWLLLLASFVVVEIHGYLFDFSYSKWLLLLFIGTAVICFNIVAGSLSAGFAWLILSLQTGESSLFILLSYLLFSAGLYYFIAQIQKMKLESEHRLSKLIHNSKQLNVFREVSHSMQQTLKLQKLLQTILTSVTAGHGLGFNRGMILLINDDGSKLNGIMGTGPMTAEEGFATWERLTKNRYKLKELIEIKETEKSSDRSLNEIVKTLEIPLVDSNLFSQILESGIPFHIKQVDDRDKELLSLATQFNMNELAIIPLINRCSKVGVLIIDNPVNKRPITAADIDSVIPLANQAAIAIQHSNLYMKIEDMALKDGLTGLYNQRSFQSLLAEHFPKNGQDSLAIIMLDIDSFKHFNDTNGHMLGNQVLIQLATVIQNSLVEGALPFRFGGEEFVLLLPNISPETALVMAEQLRINVENTYFPCGENQPQGRLTISLGLSSTKDNVFTNAQDLVVAADQALYKAKEMGRNRVVVFEGEKNV